MSRDLPPCGACGSTEHDQYRIYETYSRTDPVNVATAQYCKDHKGCEQRRLNRQRATEARPPARLDFLIQPSELRQRV